MLLQESWVPLSYMPLLDTLLALQLPWAPAWASCRQKWGPADTDWSRLGRLSSLPLFPTDRETQ